MGIRVTIFEDNRTFLDSLLLLLERNRKFTLANAFSNADNVVEKVKSSQPDIVLMDIQMPGTDGIEALKTLKAKFPGLNILMQTVFQDEDKIFKAIIHGASGYILKTTSPEGIFQAIEETYNGGAPMSPVVATKVLKLMQKRHMLLGSADESIHLTPREIEIIYLMIEGCSYKMIADRCNISFETVRSHIKNIYAKLHVGTMTEAVVFAIKNKLV